MDEVAKPVQLESASEEPYSKEDIAKQVQVHLREKLFVCSSLISFSTSSHSSSDHGHEPTRLIAELNDRPFHIQAIKTKFLDATLKDSTVGTSGGMMDATNPIKVQWEVNPQKVSLSPSFLLLILCSTSGPPCHKSLYYTISMLTLL
jgi:hypothetical protein